MPADGHEPLPEGKEPPPPGVELMAAFRWLLLALAALLAVATWWSYASAELHGDAKTAQTGTKYHCPMHPQIISDSPGECPICHMRLEAIAANRSTTAPASSTPAAAHPKPAVSSKPAASNEPPPTASAPPGTAPVKLTLDRIQAIGVRTALATEGPSSQTLRVTAYVAPTEQGAAEVHVRSPGFVEKILVSQTGITVGRDQPLFLLYSPELLQAQNELVAAQQWGDGSNATADSARRKLELLGMSPKDVDTVSKTRQPMRTIPVYAPQGGHVTKKSLVAGSYVTPEMALYEIQDLSRVYVVADVFSRDVGFLQTGATGRFAPARRPEDAIDVRVDLFYPTLNSETRTTRVRMVLKNPKGTTLRPGEYGSVDFAAPSRRAVTIPRDAVIDTGLHTYVFVVEGEGVFSPREVALGGEVDELVTVLGGLSPGERVVSGATFLIDSESRLLASAAQAAAAEPLNATASKPGEGPSCSEIDRAKFPDKWTECQKCAQVHHGMGTMEADCKNAIPKPWK
jgi:Cu(I)/Ag(I) efflux system membrane fusion protein